MTPQDSKLTMPPTGDSPADALAKATTQGGEAMRRIASDAVDVTQRSVEQWRGQAEEWRDEMAEQIRANPMRSVLIAAGAGMVIALLMRAFNR